MCLPSHVIALDQGIDWLAALNDSLLVPSSPLPGYNNNSNGMSSSLSNQNNSSSRNSLYGNNSQNNNSSTNLSSNSSTGANFNRPTTLLTDRLKYLFENFQKMSSSQVEQEKNDILYIADMMQNKSAKCDVLLRLVESFNKHAINAKITWTFQETRTDGMYYRLL